jgi:TolA-binding protein
VAKAFQQKGQPSGKYTIDRTRLRHLQNAAHPHQNQQEDSLNTRQRKIKDMATSIKQKEMLERLKRGHQREDCLTESDDAWAINQVVTKHPPNGAKSRITVDNDIHWV